jgi:hypothetical protein
MAPDVKVLLETIADQISLLYEDPEHEVLVTAEMLERKGERAWEKGESKLSRPGKAPNAINK